MYKIFVSIACLMDVDVINTIENCLENAKFPNNITFGICLQYDLNNKFFEKYKSHPQIRLKELHWKDAKGPILARYHCTNMIKDEDFFLQIDCHTRFFKNWDETLLNEYKKCEAIDKNPIISHYPINIKNMENDNYLNKIGHICTFRYIKKNSIKMHGSLYSLPKEPIKSYGIMAAMMFMKCDVLKNVPYDPFLHYGLHAEEQFYYSARLWTHGYNFFTPSCHVLGMEYETNRDRIETDTKSYHAMHASKWCQKTWSKVKYYLKIDTLENVAEEYKNDILENQTKYGLGNERNIVDYFKMIKLHDKILDIFPFYNEYQKIKWSKKFNHSMELFKQT